MECKLGGVCPRQAACGLGSFWTLLQRGNMLFRLQQTHCFHLRWAKRTTNNSRVGIQTYYFINSQAGSQEPLQSSAGSGHITEVTRLGTASCLLLFLPNSHISVLIPGALTYLPGEKDSRVWGAGCGHAYTPSCVPGEQTWKSRVVAGPAISSVYTRKQKAGRRRLPTLQPHEPLIWVN